MTFIDYCRYVYFVLFKDIQSDINRYVESTYQVSTDDELSRTLKMLEETVEYLACLDCNKDTINFIVNKAFDSKASSKDSNVNKKIEFYDLCITIACFMEAHGLSTITAYIKALRFQKEVKNSDKM